MVKASPHGSVQVGCWWGRASLLRRIPGSRISSMQGGAALPHRGAPLLPRPLTAPALPLFCSLTRPWSCILVRMPPRALPPKVLASLLAKWRRPALVCLSCPLACIHGANWIQGRPQA